MSQWHDPSKPTASDPGGYPGQQDAGAYGSAIQPQPYGGGAYPQAGGPVMGVAAGGGSGCALTREQLDAYLQQCGYGANAAMFSCYFTREGPNAPPLCIACGQPSGAHRSSFQAGSQLPHGHGTAVDMLGAALIATAHGAGFEASTPSNLVSTPSADVATVPPSRGLIMAACIMGFIAVVQLIAFVAIGFAARVPFVLIGPAILLFLTALFLLMAKKTTIRFDKPSTSFGGGRGRSAHITQQSAVNWCCPSTFTVDVASMTNVRSHQTNTRINRQYLYEVQCDVAAPNGAGANRTIVLYRGYMLDTARESVNWRAYLGSQ